MEATISTATTARRRGALRRRIERLLRPTATVLTCAILMGAAALSALQGAADLAASDARVLLAGLAEQKVQPDAGQWREAVDGLRLARHLAPWHADYHADLGRLYEWQSWQQLQQPQAARAYRQAALISYREALARRPGWGYVWAQLAHVSLAQRGFNAEVEHALAQAARLAPWELEAQRTLVWMGLSRWTALNEASRQQVKATVKRAWRLRDHRALIVALSAQFGWDEHLREVRIDVARAGQAH